MTSERSYLTQCQLIQSPHCNHWISILCLVSPTLVKLLFSLLTLYWIGSGQVHLWGESHLTELTQRPNTSLFYQPYKETRGIPKGKEEKDGLQKRGPIVVHKKTKEMFVGFLSLHEAVR